MKKWRALVLALVLCLSLVACSRPVSIVTLEDGRTAFGLTSAAFQKAFDKQAQTQGGQPLGAFEKTQEPDGVTQYRYQYGGGVSMEWETDAATDQVLRARVGLDIGSDNPDTGLFGASVAALIFALSPDLSEEQGVAILDDLQMADPSVWTAGYVAKANYLGIEYASSLSQDLYSTKTLSPQPQS